jgi:adenosylcobinamide-GDP ribazoletransferase
VKGLLGAVSFLTRVPTGTGARRPEELAGSVPWFPVVGAGVGLAVAAVYGGARLALPPLPAAALAVVAGICLTGAFHEDGLGDTADAFAGGWDRESTARILKDPRLGTFGVLAVAGSLLLRVAAVAALAPAAALAALPAAHALSRAAAVAAMTALPVGPGRGRRRPGRRPGPAGGGGAVGGRGLRPGRPAARPAGRPAPGRDHRRRPRRRPAGGGDPGPAGRGRGRHGREVAIARLVSACFSVRSSLVGRGQGTGRPLEEEG